METNNNLHHTNSLCKWAHEIIVRKAILLEKVLADDSRNFKSTFLVFRQRILTNKLDDFLQIVLFLQNFLHLLLQHAVFRIVSLEEWLENADVLGKRNVP